MNPALQPSSAGATCLSSSSRGRVRSTQTSGAERLSRRATDDALRTQGFSPHLCCRLSDLSVAKTSMAAEMAVLGGSMSFGEVHEGFYRALFPAGYGLEETPFAKVIGTCNAFLDGHPNKEKVKVWVTGHSLGAALASVFTVVLAALSHADPAQGNESQATAGPTTAGTHASLWTNLPNLSRQLTGVVTFGTPKVGDAMVVANLHAFFAKVREPICRGDGRGRRGAPHLTCARFRQNHVRYARVRNANDIVACVPLGSPVVSFLACSLNLFRPEVRPPRPCSRALLGGAWFLTRHDPLRPCAGHHARGEAHLGLQGHRHGDPPGPSRRAPGAAFSPRPNRGRVSWAAHRPTRPRAPQPTGDALLFNATLDLLNFCGSAMELPCTLVQGPWNFAKACRPGWLHARNRGSGHAPLVDMASALVSSAVKSFFPLGSYLVDHAPSEYAKHIGAAKGSFKPKATPKPNKGPSMVTRGVSAWDLE